MVKQVTVVNIARTSATGSAVSTPKSLLSKKLGNMKIKGISNIIFLSKASIREILACPKARKVCWHAI